VADEVVQLLLGELDADALVLAGQISHLLTPLRSPSALL
jgi:hypothetical protein